MTLLTFGTRIGAAPTVSGVKRNGDSLEQIRDLISVGRLGEDETLQLS